MDEGNSFLDVSSSTGTLTVQMIKDELNRKSIARKMDRIYVSSTEYNLWEKASPDSLHYRVLGPIEMYR